MKKLFIVAILILPMTSFAARYSRGSSTSISSSNFKISVDYDIAKSGAADLNGARRVFLWNNTTPTSGTFDGLQGFGITFGYSMWGGVVSLQYNTLSQQLANTDIVGATYSIQDTFNYDSIYLIYDYNLSSSDWLVWDVGIGLGKTLKYEYHQKNSGGNGEDVTWEGDAIAYKLRTNLAYPFTSSFRVGLQIQFESVSSELAASKAYATTIGGVPIASGQKLRNVNTNSGVNADMGGIHYGINMSYLF